MTGAKNLPVKQVGVYNLLKKLDYPRDAELFFVVPHDRFNNFSYQQYTDSDEELLEEPSYKLVKSVEQYVLCIDLKIKQDNWE